jgi:acetyltransferase EpsM
MNIQHYQPDANDILVFGGGGHGKAVIELLRAGGRYRPTIILDDGLEAGSSVLGVPVLGGSAQLKTLRSRGLSHAVNAVGGIGNVDVRQKVFDQLVAAGFTCPAVVHPRAVVEPSAVLEEGVQVFAMTYVSSSARIGFGSLLNAGVVVSHDCVLGRVVNLSPGALLAGGVLLEDHVQVGMGATINLNLKVGAGARVGNGATVKADVPAGTVVKAGSTWPPFRPPKTGNA